MTRTFLQQIGFVRKSYIWIRISWDLPVLAAPDTWQHYQRNGKNHLKQYVFRGKITAKGFTLRKSYEQGKDSQGRTRRTLARKYHRDGWQYAFNLSKMGATVAFYPNQPNGGISNQNVFQCLCLFYEIDDQPLSTQTERLQALTKQTGLSPAAIVFTGGKSLHAYFKLSDPLSPTDWVRLNRKLTVIQDGDPQICNPARSMRLPGMFRRKWVEGKLSPPIPIPLIHTSPTVYNPTDLESALDSTELFPYGLDDKRWHEWVKLSTKCKTNTEINPHLALLEQKKAAPERVPAQHHNHSPTHKSDSATRFATQTKRLSIPLTQCLSQANQALLGDGCSQGNRNANGYRLAKDLLGTTQFLTKQGVSYTPDAYALFASYGQRCSPILDPDEQEQIWHSAVRTPSEPSRSPTSILNSVDYWTRTYRARVRLQQILSYIRNRSR